MTETIQPMTFMTKPKAVVVTAAEARWLNMAPKGGVLSFIFARKLNINLRRMEELHMIEVRKGGVEGPVVGVAAGYKQPREVVIVKTAGSPDEYPNKGQGS